MNVKLLQQIRKAILKEPSRFNMGWWVDTSDGNAACGTSACIAGFAIMLNLTKGKFDKEQWKKAGETYDADEDMTPNEMAIRQLKINAEQADRLFNDACWPVKFREPYQLARPNSREAAKAAAARITFFIKTKGTDRIKE